MRRGKIISDCRSTLGVSALLGLVFGFAAVFGSPALAVGEDGIRLPVSSFTLDNGMQFVVVEDHRSPVVTQMIWYRVGSADEPAGKSGIAHFLEHLMFKGTETLGPGEFSEQVAINGGTDNAFTSQDYTAYHQRIARDRLDIVMRLEADRMTNLQIDEREVALEREVVLEERARRYGNEPSAQLGEQMDAALYLNHPYGRPIIGWEHEIEALTHDDAVAFYERYYTPANAIAVVAGDVTPDEVRALAQDTFGKIENRAGFEPRVRVAEPPQTAERRVVLRHRQVNLERWRRTFVVPPYSKTEPQERAALKLFAEILGGGSTSRLYRKLVIDEKIAVDIGAYYAGRGLDYGEFGIQAIPVAGTSMDDLERRIEEVIGELLSDGVSEAELARAKTELIADEVFDQDSQSRMARTFGAALTTGSTVEDVIAWPSHMRAVAREAVGEVARRHLVVERSVTGLLLAERDGSENVQ